MQRYQQFRNVLGSKANISVVVANQEFAEELFDTIWQSIAQFENTFSRFTLDSELSQFNQLAGTWVEVSSEFRAFLEVSLRYATMTEGIFNPLVLPALQRTGYRGSWPTPDAFDSRLDLSARSIMPADSIQIDGSKVLLPPTAAFDSGGIGKGYMLDLLGELLQKRGVGHYCVSLGGDVLCAGFDAGGVAWRIGVADAYDVTKMIATIQVHDGKQTAIASSSIVDTSGEGWHHLIDPRTGVPSNSSVTMATIIATRGTTADVFAKVLVIDPEHPLHAQTGLDPVSGMIVQFKNKTYSVERDSRSMVAMV